MKYENKKNGKVATLESTNEKFKTVVLVFEDGTTTTISISTLKRWWKEIPEEETTEQDAPEPLKEVVDAQGDFTVINDFENNDVYIEVGEDVAGDGTPLVEVGKEIAEQAKEKAQKAKEKSKKASKKEKSKATTKKKVVVSKENKDKSKKESTSKIVYNFPDTLSAKIEKKNTGNKQGYFVNPSLVGCNRVFDNIVFSFAAEKNDDVFIYPNNMLSLKVDEAIYVRFVFSKKSITAYITNEAAEAVGIDCTSHTKDYFGSIYKLDITSKADEKTLKTLLKKSREYQIEKNLKKAKNKENTKTKKGEKDNGKVQSR